MGADTVPTSLILCFAHNSLRVCNHWQRLLPVDKTTDNPPLQWRLYLCLQQQNCNYQLNAEHCGVKHMCAAWKMEWVPEHTMDRSLICQWGSSPEERKQRRVFRVLYRVGQTVQCLNRPNSLDGSQVASQQATYLVTLPVLCKIAQYSYNLLGTAATSSYRSYALNHAYCKL